MRINLLPKDERPLNQYKVRWEFLVGLLAILLLGMILTLTWLENTTIQTLRADLDIATEREIYLQAQLGKVNELKKELSELEKLDEQIVSLLFGDQTTLASVPFLTKKQNPKLWIEKLTWTDQKIELSGYTQDMLALSEQINYLRERSDLVTVKTLYPYDKTDFYLFTIEVEGVVADD